MKTIWSKFYWRDWQSDTGLRSCSISARGLWFEMLCIMAQNESRPGYLELGGTALSDAALCRMIGATPAEVEQGKNELHAAGIPSIDRGVWFSRRMVRDSLVREAGKANAAKRHLASEEEEAISQEPRAMSQSGPQATPATTPQGGPQATPQGATKNLATNHPTLEDCKAVNSTIGLSAAELEKCFHHYNAQGWKTGAGVPLKSLASVIAKWKGNASNFANKNAAPEVKTGPATEAELQERFRIARKAAMS